MRKLAKTVAGRVAEPSSANVQGALSARQGRAEVAALRREHTTLLHEYDEARARVREYSSRSFLRPGERLEARTLERLTQHKRAALGDVGKRLSQLEAHAAERPSLAPGGDR